LESLIRLSAFESGECVGSGKVGTTKLSWSFLWILIIGVGVAGLSGYAVYKYRIRVYDVLYSGLVIILKHRKILRSR